MPSNGLIAAGESGRPLVEHTIGTLLGGDFDRNTIKPYFANLTIGSGAAAGANPTGGLTVFVKGLPFAMTSEDIKTLFAECGPIETVFLMTFEDTGKSRGMARIKFGSSEAATAAVAYNNTEVGGRTIGVEINREKPGFEGGAGSGGGKTFEPRKPTGDPTNTIFMGNLSVSPSPPPLPSLLSRCLELSLTAPASPPAFAVDHHGRARPRGLCLLRRDLERAHCHGPRDGQAALCRAPHRDDRLAAT